MEKEITPCKVLIIGSGPAGMSAAIYTARARLETIVVTGTTLGGQASLTAEIENYPGFPSAINGVELIDLMQKQAEAFGAVLEYDVVRRVDFSQRPFEVETDMKLFAADFVIIAAGSNHILLSAPGEKEFTGKGVSYCATCDGWFYRGKKVVVVGGGNSAIEEALFLTKFVESVKVIHRRDALRADVILQEKAMANPKISFVWDSVVTKVVGEDKVTAVGLKNVKTGEESMLETDGVFVFIGSVTNTELFADQLEMSGGIIKVDKDMETSVKGVYAAGESVDNIYRQVIVSAGSGAMAGISVSKQKL